MKNLNLKKLAYLCGSLICVVLFQNCSDTPMTAVSSSLTCVDLNNCVETVTDPNSLTDPSSPANSSSSASLFNIVSGEGKASCEKLIGETYGKQISCTLGGGCGISCGKPGNSCASANPQHYGACVSQADLQAAPNYVATAGQSAKLLYNFVAGDKATCESSIVFRLGFSASCSIGGGCGLSCGMPNGACPSANPSAWGACLLN